MVPPHKNTGFAISNLVSFEMSGLDNDEELVAIDFDFRHLFAVQGVFYGQRMQIERRLQTCHFRGCRLGNADPGKFAVGLLKRITRQGEFFGAFAEPIDVRRNNCHENRSRWQRLVMWHPATAMARGSNV